MRERYTDFLSGFMAEHSPLSEEASERYLHERFQRIRDGETVWLRRNFDDTDGLIFDLYQNRLMKAFVDVSQGGLDVYARDYAVDENFRLIAEADTLERAVAIAERHEMILHY